MKVKLALAATVIVVATLFGSKLLAQETPITKAQLPKGAQAFLNQYFPGQALSRVTRDKELMKTEYEVYLGNSVKVEFDRNGKWKEVDGKHNEIPTGFILPSIARYISGNFPGQKIVKIERSNTRYEVGLSNGADLDFSSKGAFLKMDD
ncbi:PepSY-like domain-containing protein [Niabella drilacis]|uniref:Putative beta-lactamase-inhibitor-like, PepSY-like n=1 Tax=Niabella drilacis (strain DSM 25811 / CCM 8410 / CCUG 62505 / LMG 26954 / E90) TaxID=1285928 RepID=A0A1G6IJZ8_NIADE|nr:PepSY-like domain-containing protein [Niabella drilacis]SDC06849.1 Putative beta-lactamase-inhibitor-like, PepSY-like [Niabella drilacis]